jgi:hypothetical protein
MQPQAQMAGVGSIYALLTDVSARPRYAFLLLQLVAELADERGHAGPFVRCGSEQMLLRDWLSTQLLPMSEQKRRRARLRSRIEASLRPSLTGEPELDDPRIEQAVEDQVLAVGRANVSRAISDLVRAKLMTRHYAGYATNHHNRGGGRHVVYVVEPWVLRLLRRTPEPRPTPTTRVTGQGDLFAA